MRWYSHFRRNSRHRERGYVLMTLLLTLALMIILAAAIVPTITFEIKRDREEEMIHRGVQYSRAIRAYYKKFNRYPMKIEDLESTNQLRFLRKRYKDPLTGKDFRLLHFGEVKMAGGAGMIPGATPIGQNGTLNGPGGLQQAAAFGSNSAFGGNSAFGNSNSPFGQNAQTLNAANQQNQPAASAQGTDSSQSGPNSSQSGSSAQPGSQANADGTTDANAPGQGNLNGNSGDKLANTTFGGAPIVGVASTSKDPTIREYDKKKKYNEWQFVYDPTFDRGYLITTPYQPQLQMFGAGPQNVNGPGGAAQPGQNNGFGSNSGFGTGFANTPSPMQNNPQPAPGGYGNQNSQPNNPPQQQ